MTIIKAVSGYLMYPQISIVTYYSPPPPLIEKRKGRVGVGWGEGGGEVTTQKKNKNKKRKKTPWICNWKTFSTKLLKNLEKTQC